MTTLITKVAFGALVKTTMGDFFIAIGAGIIDLDGKKFMTISPQAPIGEVILDKIAGESFDFRGKKYKILSIC